MTADPKPQRRIAADGRRSGRCAVCGKTFPAGDLVPIDLVHPGVAERVRADHPGLDAQSRICRGDRHRYRARYVEGVIERDRGEVGALEREVIGSMERHEVLSRDVESQFEARRTIGERIADRVATFGGSWPFIGLFFTVLLVWIVFNSLTALRQPFDPYPFILLNLILSCLAAIQAPIIMMSQNRQGAKDRLRAEHDYRVNLKAELEIRHLHSKIDQLLSHQWQRLLEIQQVQMEVLEEISERAALTPP